MGEQQTDDAPKKNHYRSPPPRLVGEPRKDLSPAEKELIVDALVGNLVAVVLKRYEAAMAASEHDLSQGDTTCE